MMNATEGVGDRLRVAREKAGMSQAELARRVKANRASIYQWEHDGVRSIRLDYLVRLSDALGVDIRWLATGTDTTRPTAPQGATAAIPVIRWGDFGESRTMLDTAQIAVPACQASGECYATRIAGDSMAPTFDDGEMVIIDPTRAPEHGDYVVGTLGGYPLIRRYLLEAGQALLAPTNPRYPVTPADDTWQCAGVVAAKYQVY